MSAASYLEIVELSSGELVLRRTDTSEGEAEPLVTIRFSEEARAYLGEHLGEVGRGMIGAGIQLVGQLQSRDNLMLADDDRPATLH